MGKLLIIKEKVKGGNVILKGSRHKRMGREGKGREKKKIIKKYSLAVGENEKAKKHEKKKKNG